MTVSVCKECVIHPGPTPPVSGAILMDAFQDAHLTLTALSLPLSVEEEVVHMSVDVT